MQGTGNFFPLVIPPGRRLIKTGIFFRTVPDNQKQVEFPDRSPILFPGTHINQTHAGPARSTDATLDFEMKNDAEFILKDNIDGLVGYNVNIKGYNKNTLYLHNDIRNADVSFDNVNIDGIDGKAQIFNFNSLQLGHASRIAWQSIKSFFCITSDRNISALSACIA